MLLGALVISSPGWLGVLWVRASLRTHRRRRINDDRTLALYYLAQLGALVVGTTVSVVTSGVFIPLALIFLLACGLRQPAINRRERRILATLETPDAWIDPAEIQLPRAVVLPPISRGSYV
ncbi:MAG TPA: hypothetical protein VGM90_02740 [Kofleriaceae bacterium]